MDMKDVHKRLADGNVIVTPEHVAMEMINTLPANLWTSPELKNMKFLDVCCKSGIYLKILLLKLMTAPALINEFPDDKIRKKYILDNMLYGIAVCKVSLELTRLNLYDKVHIKGNIRQIADTYEDYIYIFKNNDYRFIRDLIKEQFGDMKIDVIIGNPPYQENREGGGRKDNASPLYQEFVLKALQLNADYVSMIIPAKWYTGNSNNADVLRNKLMSEHLVNLVDYPKAIDCFPTIMLAGGVCHFLYGKEVVEACDFVQYMDNVEYRSTEKIEDTDYFVRYSHGRSIIKKVLAGNNRMYLSQVNGVSSKFGISTKERGNVIETEHDNIVLKSSDGIGYISLDEVQRNSELVPMYKIITGYMAPGGGIQKANVYGVINEPKILRPNEVCTDTYQIIGYFNTYEKAANYLTYLKTKFVRFLIQMTVNNASITRDNFRFVPMQDDFSHSWNDAMLYEKYGLTQDEIDFVEKLIKPMQ